MLLTAPLPDELFVSVLARLGRLNGMSDLREVTERCFGLDACPSFVDARLNLPKFCARFSNAYGEPVRLLEQLTTLGARRCLGEIDNTAWSALVFDGAPISVGELTFHGATELRFCPSCREDDIHQIGMTYWHRSHQLPILHRCFIHGDRLKKSVIKRPELHRSFPLPSECRNERESHLPQSWNDDFEMDLAAFSEALLTQVRPHQGLVERALFEGLREQRFLNSNDSLRAHDLRDFLIPMVFHGDGSEVSEEGLRVVRHIVSSVHQPAKGLAFGRALLLCALFGNWRMVAERCKWLETFGASVDHRIRDQQRLEKDAPNNVNEMHRGKCLAYIADDLGSSRLGFTRKHYRSFRWLLHYDRAWLDHILPISERDLEQTSLF